MRKNNKIISFILSFLIIGNLALTSNVSAYQTISKNSNTFSNQLINKKVKDKNAKVENKLYKNKNVRIYSQNKATTTSNDNVFSTLDEAANYLKNQMVKRNGKIEFTIKKSNYENLYMNIFKKAMEDDASADSSEGDYLYRHWENFDCKWDDSNSNETKFTYNMNYLSTYKQEQAVNNEIKKVLDELDVYNKDDYTKAKAVHDFITENITYDNTLTKYSAYDALITKNVVCNGYATLTYKMLKELGIGVRCITGYSNGETHAWNIVKIDNSWYNIDNTWDSESDSVMYTYFLKNNSEFIFHDRDQDFDTNEFNLAYPMSKTSYQTEDYYNETFSLNKLQKTIGLSKTFELCGINLKDDDKVKEFSSSDDKVATVDQNGKVTAVGVGKAVITCKTEEGYEANCRVKVRYDINNTQISEVNSSAKLIYDGSVKKPSVKVVYSGKTLQENKDYCVNYGDNTLSGKGSITIIGIGDYTGQKTITFKIYPSKVKNVRIINSTTTSLKLSWSKISGVTGYDIYKSSSKSGKYTKIGNVLNTNLANFTDKNLSKTNKYYYKIKAYKVIDGENIYGEYSDILFGSTEYPGRVYDLKQNYSYRTLVKLSWDKVGYVKGYRIYRATSKNGTYKKIAQNTGSSNVNYTDKNVSPGKTYYYKVRAYKIKSGSKEYGEYSDILKTSTKCNAPEITAYSNGTGKVKITWEKVSGAAGYAIYCSESKDGYFEKIETISNSSVSSFIKEGIESGKTYYYKVRAFRSADIGNVYSYSSNIKCVKIK